MPARAEWIVLSSRPVITRSIPNPGSSYYQWKVFKAEYLGQAAVMIFGVALYARYASI
ncbi:MAG TPA: hypothetical protein VMW53_05630 [archaeon]|nr:hypothetical protein [archaeon]